jgi:outer membrane lipoprotein SlyB
MLVTKKMLLALTLIGALVGAGIGALATRTASTTSAAETSYNTTATSDRTQPVSYNAKTPGQMAAENGPQFGTAAEQTAYREGFDAGYAACGTENTNPNYSRATTTRSAYRAPQRTSSSASSRRVYYDYGTAPKGRSFWQKHRDKLTLAIGTGAGAAIGGLIGGKKGAGIGSLAGLGSSALYTYKLRKRSRNY